MFHLGNGPSSFSYQVFGRGSWEIWVAGGKGEPGEKPGSELSPDSSELADKNISILLSAKKPSLVASLHIVACMRQCGGWSSQAM